MLWLIPVLLVAAMAVILWSVFLTPAGTFHATVREYPSGRPLAGATVWSRTVGWGMVNGFPVMNAVISDTTVTDDRGEFRLPKPSLLASLDRNFAFYARKPGYAARAKLRGSDWQPDLWLSPLPVGHESVVPGWVNIDCGQGSVWSLWKCDSLASADSARADVLVFTDPGEDSLLYIRAFDRGGVVYLPGGRTGIHPASLECVAPESGYARQVTVPLAHGPGTCFIRTRDGARYAKVDLDTSQLRQLINRRYRYDVIQRSWYNPSGARALCSAEPHPG